MSDPKFTKGPWHSCHKGKCKCKMVWSAEADHPVAKVEAGEWGDTYPVIKDGKAIMESIPYGEISEVTAQANANLIAAAPELLEALEALMVFASNVPYMSTACKRAAAAIAKALGE